MRYLKGYQIGGPIVFPNATKEQKEELQKKGVKVAEVDEMEANRIKREIANR